MGLREARDDAKAILGKHLPGGYSDSLLIDTVKAIRNAEVRGFDECLSAFYWLPDGKKPPRMANDE